MKKPVKKTKTAPSPASGLRKKAEKTLSKKKDLPAKKQEALSPEKTRKMLHELQVQQIELEMQNEEMRRAQTELNNARTRYFDLYDLAPVGYCTISEQGLILEANLTAATLLNMARGKLVKQLITRFILKEDQDIYYLHRKKLFDTSKPKMCDLRMVKNDGTVFWAHLTGVAAKNEDGSTVCRVVISDITERKRAEEKLNGEEQRFRALAEQSSDIIVLMNLEGIITYVNPEVERALGFKPEERIGARGFERIHPDDLKSLTEKFNILAKDTNPSVLRSEIHLRHKDGSWRTFEAVGSNLVNNNVVEAIIINYHDITERKLMEEKLRKSEEMYRRITENMSGFISELNAQGIFRYNSPSIRRILGYNPEELIGTCAFDLVHPEDREYVIARYMEGVNTKSHRDVEQRYLRKDGTYIWLRSSGQPLYGSAGEHIGMIVNSHDITERKLAEESLKETELKFRTIFDSASDGILLAQTSDRKFSTTNKQMCEMLGYTNRELLKLGISDIHPVESLSFVIDQIEKLLRKEILIAHNIPMMRKDKSVFFADVGASPITSEGKDCIIGMFRDITERKKAEEMLLLIKKAVESSSDAIGISDAQGHHFYHNEAFTKLFEYTAEELGAIGGGPAVYADKDIAREVFGTINSGNSWSGELEMISKSGRKFPVALRADAIKDESGKIIGLIGVNTDITERKKSEEALRREQLFSKSVLDNLPGIFYLYTFPECRLVLWNKQHETLLGFNAEEMKDRHVTEWFAPENRTDLLKAIDKVMVKGQNSLESYLVAKDGHQIPFFLPGVRFEVDGRSYFMGVGMDLTERKIVEEELKKYREHLEELARERTIKLEAANKELEAFSYSASHDLRAPLRTIDGFSQALLEDCGDKLDLQGKKYLTRVITAARRMGLLIEDLLKLSRITRMEMNIETVNLTQIARSIINELQSTQPQRHVRVIIADDLKDNVDSRLIRIIFENLLENAWKFTGKNKEAVIEFGSEKKEGLNIYFIRDNGAGFDMAYAKNLFAPFQRLHTEDEYPGTGIGLATVQRIINRHGGKIWAEGQPGKGATFYFILQE